jgi:hypothetical protein
MNNHIDYEWCDETKFSYISLPNKINYKRDVKIQDEILFSLVCKWILNVCQLIEDESWDVYSIPLNPKNVEEKIEIEEILADLSLAELLSWDTWDRSIIPGNDYRSKSWENITGNNLRIYHSWIYSIFDFDDTTLWNIKYKEILAKLWESITNLYWDYNDLIAYPSYFINVWLLSELYWNRILKKVEEFLKRYDSVEWKNLFLAQIRQSVKPRQFAPQRVNDILWNAKDFWYKKDEEKYENFIKTLKRLKAIFSKNNKALEKYISSKKFSEEEIRKKIRDLAEWFNKAFLKRVIEEELG